MTHHFTFPELDDPADCPIRVQLKPLGAQADAALSHSPETIAVTNCVAAGYLPLANVLQAHPDLRDALYKALREVGAI